MAADQPPGGGPHGDRIERLGDPVPAVGPQGGALRPVPDPVAVVLAPGLSQRVPVGRHARHVDHADVPGEQRVQRPAQTPGLEAGPHGRAGDLAERVDARIRPASPNHLDGATVFVADKALIQNTFQYALHRPRVGLGSLELKTIESSAVVTYSSAVSDTH